MKSNLKSTLAITVMGLAAFVLSACYTIEGAGRDVEAVGAGLADTADTVRPYE